MTDFTWNSIYTDRKHWRRRKWNKQYWIAYGMQDYTLPPFGTHYWVLEKKSDGCGFLLVQRKRWNRSARLDRWWFKWDKQ